MELSEKEKLRDLSIKINSLEGFVTEFWENHGLQRIYLNRVAEEKSAAFIQFKDAKLSLKNFCKLTISEIILMTESVKINTNTVNSEFNSENTKNSQWQQCENGFIKEIGEHTIITPGKVSQSDLDDFYG